MIDDLLICGYAARLAVMPRNWRFVSKAAVMSRGWRLCCETGGFAGKLAVLSRNWRFCREAGGFAIKLFSDKSKKMRNEKIYMRR